MQNFGPTLLPVKVGVLDDLTRMIVCADKLPSNLETCEGAIVQLTASQQGYVATHIYKATATDWVDVTKNFSKIETLPSGGHVRVDLEVENDAYTGFLVISWTDPTFTDSLKSIVGKHSYDVLVRKHGSEFPTTPDDGQVVVRAEGNVTNYRYDDWRLMCQDGYVDYNYRLFHVFDSGWMCYTDRIVNA